jgi:hypothetical protein
MNWKEFEENVRELLQLQGWSIEPEKIILHKKVDAYAEKLVDFMRREKIAIECKMYDKPLDRAQVSEIQSDYFPLIQKGYIDFILLVTLNGLTPSAATYACNSSYITHIKHIDLLNSVINFSSYVNGLIALCSEEGLKNLYINQPFEDYEGKKDLNLLQALLDWVNQADTSPVAVLGGYGVGKSTLAKRLAASLSEQFLENSQKRLPILITLEDITTDQSLEGLLGRHFTSVSVVQNYNFHVFMKLNCEGRFVVILDGFDEMKKTMSWEAMLYNLSQLNRLVNANAKVLLLGRPSAFLNDAEYNEALHGRRPLLNKEKEIPGWPDYHEYHLLPFQLEQIIEYINKHVSYLKSKHELTAEITDQIKNVMKTLKSKREKRLTDLVSRPVQLKMLLEILPSYGGSLDNLTTAILYSEFIDLVIRRELTKKAREEYSVQDRRRFASDLAFWMWQNNMGTEIVASKIPEKMFEKYMRPNISKDSVKRDLLAGCFLERKPPEGLYLPHRSFLEFLVAEKLVDMVMNKNKEVLEIDYVTPEISSFFIEIIGRNAVGEWREWMRKLADDHIKVSPSCINLLKSSCEIHEFTLSNKLIAPLLGISVEVLAERKAVSKPSMEDVLAKKTRHKKKQTNSSRKETSAIRKRGYRKSN